MGQKSEQDYRECRGGSILASMTGSFSLSVKDKMNIKLNVMKYAPIPYIVSYRESHPICNCWANERYLWGERT
jgi:hypothetical protein